MSERMRRLALRDIRGPTIPVAAMNFLSFGVSERFIALAVNIAVLAAVSLAFPPRKTTL
jgi:hypothetical protein